MNIYETEWMRIRFPSPWRIQTTRDKIIFTPLPVTSDTRCEIICLKSDYRDQTDSDLQQFMEAFAGSATEPERISLGSLTGFRITIPDHETRLYLRQGRFMIIGLIVPIQTDLGFLTQTFELISNIELKDAEPSS